MKLKLATRGSALAWTQSGQVADALRALGHEVELVRVTTQGDVSSAPLASLGGAGVFVGAVRAAVLAGDADLAVHSFKDLPTAAAAGLVLAAVPPREDPSDALCARDHLTLAGLPPHARVGTGSPRRAAQLLALRADVEVLAIRGNVETRLRRASEDLDAVVLATAGLRRLGLEAAVTEHLDPEVFLPAPAQGALAIECRTDAPAGLLAAVAALDHRPSRLAALAERQVLAHLEAGCAAPVAAHATVVGGRLSLAATVVAKDGSRQVRAKDEGELNEAAALALGIRVGAALLAAGAAELGELGARKPLPLAGRRVLLPARCPAGTADTLAAAGAEVVSAEFTRFEQLPTAGLEAALGENWDWLVFTSAQTVVALLDSGVAFERLDGPKVAAVGSATAAALQDAGLLVDLVAEPGGGAALAAAFPDGPGRVLLPGAEAPSTQPAEGLTAKGWTVRTVGVYRTVAATLPAGVLAAWAGFDAFVVTAGSVARAGVAAAGLPGPKVVAMGAAAATAARDAGLEVIAVAERPDAGGIAGALLAALPEDA